jgi:hypothetical protein
MPYKNLMARTASVGLSHWRRCSNPESAAVDRIASGMSTRKAGWSLGCVSAIDSNGRTIWIADAHRLTEGPTRCADQKSCSGVEQRARAGT